MVRPLLLLAALLAALPLVGCPAPPPTLDGLVIEIVPSVPTAQDDLVATVVVHANGSNKETFRYEYGWEVDGVLLDDLVEREVPAEQTASGEIWTVTATPFIDWNDETLVGAPSSDEVTIDALSDDDDATDDDDSGGR